jgi:hypothetical protein
MEVITANSLGSGRVVFQTPFGWSFHLDEAEVLLTKESVQAALQRATEDAAANRIVEPYAIEVSRRGDDLVPLRLRERIRAAGPTTGNSTKRPLAPRSEAA